jgi:hypothetical protein
MYLAECLRKIRQYEGIKLAQMKNIYAGRKKGAKTSPSKLVSRYKNVADLIDKSELSVRRCRNHRTFN